MRVVTLKRRAEFLRVRGGARCSASAFVIETRPRALGGKDEAAAEPRFGFTVTKKLGGAVLRNRIRRRLKEALRSLPSGTALPGHDYVLVARADAASCGFDSLAQELASALRRVNNALQQGVAGPMQARKSGRTGSSAGAEHATAPHRTSCDQGSAPARGKT